jgi:DNA-binding CsgD family transcriptional regulator
MPRHPYPLTLLTPRDRDVIALVLAGHTNAEIARRLDLQLQTLKNTLSAIYNKLGVSTRLQLAVLLLRDAASAFRP